MTKRLEAERLGARCLGARCLGVALLTSNVAVAQAAETGATQKAGAETAGGVSMSASGHADTGGATSADPDMRAPNPSMQDYLRRYKPEAGLWEVGLFGGLFWPASEHNLHAERLPQRAYAQPALELGARLAYFPLAFVGGEVEYALSQGSVAGSVNASFDHYRAHAVLQLPYWSVTPFVTVGGGALSAVSEAMGSDADPAFHFGAGVKLPAGRLVSLRLDLRDNLSQKNAAEQGSQVHHAELLLGATFSFERTRPKPPPPPLPSDRDGDGVIDERDACPDVAALTPDGCPLDSDGDGVHDGDDHCPREAGPAPLGCPDLDQDQDKVPLPCDVCPDEPGAPPDGCPIRDTDGDGIFDDKDQCVNEPETRNGFQDQDGCPDEVPAEVQQFTGAIQGIQFELGKAQIRPTSAPTLDKAVEVLQKYPEIKIEISGHTSSEGDAAVNDQLSKDRAAAVKQYLVDKGVAEDRVTTRGVGSSEPVADNETPAGREQNRRIEFKIVRE